MTDDSRPKKPDSKLVAGLNAKGDLHATKKTWAEAERYIQLGVTLPAATVIGWILGAGADRLLGTHWLYLAGLLLGIAAGFVQLIRIAVSVSSKKDDA